MKSNNDDNKRRPRRTARSRGSEERLYEIRNRVSKSNSVYDDYDEDSYYDGDDLDVMGRNSLTDRDSSLNQRNRSARNGINAETRNNIYGSRAAAKNLSSLEQEAAKNERIYGINNSDSRRVTADPSVHNPKTKRSAAAMRGKKKHTLKRLLATLLVLLLVFIGGFFAWSQVKNLLKPKYWTIAVFGVDSRDGNLGAGALSDVIMLASINRRTGDVNLTSVYRDTYLQIDDEGNYHKINEAYFKGGYEQAIAALNRNFQLDIDDYVTFNWKAVAEGITMLGGIDMDISDSEFAYINAFITETVNSTGLGSVQLEHSGMNHLDGVQAVAYGRLRLMDTDFNRTARQRKVLQLALEKAKSADKKTLVATAMTVMSEIKTSIGADDILELAQHAKNYNLVNAVGFPFSRDTTYVGKMDVVVPATLASNVLQLHPFLYGDDASDFELNDTVKAISDHIQEKTGIGELENAAIPKIGGGTGVTKSSSDSETTAATQKETKKDTSGDTKAETQAETTEEETTEETIEDIETTEEETEETSEETTEETSEEIEETTKGSSDGPKDSDSPSETEFGPAIGPGNGPGAGPGGDSEGPQPVFS